MKTTYKLEICCQDIESVKAAKEGGADRVELCSALETGGVTPSIGMIKEAVRIFGKGVFVLIRERSGDFVYTREEIEVMREDILAAKEVGASGVVIGALTSNNDVDMDSLSILTEAAQGVEITFHRAFDEVKDPFKAIESIIEAGCHRILSSGQETGAEKGVSLLAELNKKADGRIIILPGAGVTSKNCREILKRTGCGEIHASAKEESHGSWKSSLSEIKKIKENLL